MLMVCSNISEYSLLFSIKAALYVLFLTLLSFALIYGSTRDDPTQYDGGADHFRALCEIFSIIFLMLHLVDEISEIIRFVCRTPG